ncbi:hypothetical protein EYF80_020165 [Liparis tanakae]|uniref:Uncharacterized protein n=1 Tax=Liparis tanakae TaxID=230148 RepID=A0A4Z2HUK8_9TELE|nr:hypothetical protein EYF80_020165 [Liparis tanakae]
MQPQRKRSLSTPQGAHNSVHLTDIRTAKGYRLTSSPLIDCLGRWEPARAAHSRPQRAVALGRTTGPGCSRGKRSPLTACSRRQRLTCPAYVITLLFELRQAGPTSSSSPSSGSDFLSVFPSRELTSISCVVSLPLSSIVESICLLLYLSSSSSSSSSSSTSSPSLKLSSRLSVTSSYVLSSSLSSRLPPSSLVIVPLSSRWSSGSEYPSGPSP